MVDPCGCERIFRGHSYGLYSAQFSPDGLRLVTASYKTARVWEVATGACVQT
eukprot:COSAG06_NODE_61636_length_267_cov_0.613095_1_plen_51_part_10